MEELKTLDAMGFTMPSPAYLFGALLFGLIGWAAYRYGKKLSIEKIKWIGVALMLYPYMIPETWLMYLVGCALCVALYVSRR